MPVKQYSTGVLSVVAGITFNSEVVVLHAMEAYRRDGGIAPLIRKICARWPVSGQTHAPAALPEGMIRSAHSVGRWLGPRDDLDLFLKKKR